MEEFTGKYNYLKIAIIMCITDEKFPFRLHNIGDIDFSRLSDSRNNGEDNLSETLANNVLVDIMVTERSRVNITTFAVTLLDDKPLFVYGGEDRLFVRNDSINRSSRLPNGLNGIKRVQSTDIVT